MLNGLNQILLDSHYKTECQGEIFPFIKSNRFLQKSESFLAARLCSQPATIQTNKWSPPARAEPSLMHHGEDIRNTYPVLLMWSIQSIRPWISKATEPFPCPLIFPSDPR